MSTVAVAVTNEWIINSSFHDNWRSSKEEPDNILQTKTFLKNKVSDRITFIFYVKHNVPILFALCSNEIY